MSGKECRAAMQSRAVTLELLIAASAGEDGLVQWLCSGQTRSWRVAKSTKRILQVSLAARGICILRR